MNWNDLYRIKIFFKDGVVINTIYNLAEFEEWYGKNSEQFYSLEMELVKEEKTLYNENKKRGFL